MRFSIFLMIVGDEMQARNRQQSEDDNENNAYFNPLRHFSIRWVKSSFHTLSRQQALESIYLNSNETCLR